MLLHTYIHGKENDEVYGFKDGACAPEINY